MKFVIKAYVLQDIGKRDNQEDAFYPPFINPCHFERTDRKESFYDGDVHTDDRLFLLCDGMGGHERGEEASQLVCNVMAESLCRMESEGQPFSDVVVSRAVEDAMNALDDKDCASSERKMGTTMTMLRFHERGITVAHIGDSRVYHFRPAKGRKDACCLFRTEDHSLANDLLKIGRLTYQQIPNFKDKHVLTRSMVAGLPKHPVADIYNTTDVRKGDVFLMCSDGLLEEIYDEDLCAMLTNPDYTDEQRVQLLLNFCEGNADNHTAWIVRVEDVIPQPGEDTDVDADKESGKGVISLLKNQLLRLLKSK